MYIAVAMPILVYSRTDRSCVYIHTYIHTYMLLLFVCLYTVVLKTFHLLEILFTGYQYYESKITLKNEIEDERFEKKITKIRAYFNKSKRYQMYYYNMLLIACLPIFTLSKGSILYLLRL